jgi:ABC-type Mn2+/Zn2+ transport system permease subunit
MIEPFQFAFMQRALLAGALVGLLCAVIGTYVVHKGLSFMGAGIAHASFGGVALGVWLDIQPLLGAMAFCLAVAWSIAWLSLNTQVREDTAIGIFFASTMALGILVIGLIQGYRQDLFGYLFGSILAVSPADLWIILSCATLVLALLWLFGKELLFVIFDPEGAAVSGLSARGLYYLLITLVTVTVVVSIKIVGIVLVSALLITPAAAASQLSERFGRILFYAVLIGIGSTLAGLLLSYWWDTASGATIVMVVTVIFLITSLISPARRR